MNPFRSHFPLDMAKAMKAMRAMKAKKPVSARLAKRHVFFGKTEKTVTGLKKMDLFKNAQGRIVSRKKSALAKKRGNFRGWSAALSKARKTLGLKGFVAVNGKTAQGRTLYAEAKSFYTR